MNLECCIHILAAISSRALLSTQFLASHNQSVRPSQACTEKKKAASLRKSRKREHAWKQTLWTHSFYIRKILEVCDEICDGLCICPWICEFRPNVRKTDREPKCLLFVKKKDKRVFNFFYIYSFIFLTSRWLLIVILKRVFMSKMHSLLCVWALSHAHLY